MSTLQSAHQHRQDSRLFEIREKGGGIQNERTQRRKAKRVEYKKTCSHCGGEYTCWARNQKYCSITCYGKRASIRKANPYNDLECISCLAHLGFGCKTISKKLYKTNYATIRNIIKKRGLPASSSKRSANRHVDSCIKKHVTIQEQKRQEMINRCDKMLRVISGLKKKCRVINEAARNYGPGFDWREMSWASIQYWANIEENRQRCAEAAKKRWRKRDIKYRIKSKLRNGVHRMLRLAKQGKKGRRTTEFLGTTFDNAKKRIESKFKKGMTWQNHGTVWEIDHIIPLSSFDFTKPNSLKIANHISNLQPLFIYENRKKRDRIICPHQFELL